MSEVTEIETLAFLFFVGGVACQSIRRHSAVVILFLPPLTTPAATLLLLRGIIVIGTHPLWLLPVVAGYVLERCLRVKILPQH